MQARSWLPWPLPTFLCVAGLQLFSLASAAQTTETNRSPVDLVLSKDESWLATVNQTSHSVSLLRSSDGRILAELPIGERPVAIALHPNGTDLLATCSHSGTLHFLRVQGNRLEPIDTLDLGFQPHGIAVTPDGALAYVALTDADCVAIIDLETRALVETISVGRWPRYLALSGDGTRLAVGTSGDRGISLVDTVARKLITIDRFVGLNIGHMQLSHDGESVYFPWMVYRRNPITDRNIRQGWVMASRLGRVHFDKGQRREALSLDPPGEAVADPFGVALTSDEAHLVISSSGTHELILLKTHRLPFTERGSTDHIDPSLHSDEERFARVHVGGRPMGIRIAKDNDRVFVANYLDNTVQVVSLRSRSVVATFPIGGSAEPSLERRGEAIFFDAKRSLDQWYSCHSCHYDGGTNAVTMDTMNDGTAFTFKTVLPLYHVDQTGPWTWHGWQYDFLGAMNHSLKTTMLGKPPTDDDARALAAYLASLKPAPNPWMPKVSDETSDEADAIERGKAIFHGAKGACVQCHQGPFYSQEETHELGLESNDDAYQGFNTPSLTGTFRKVLFLHDGRASSLEQLLRGPHAPERVEGNPLTEQELSDLIAYLKTL